MTLLFLTALACGGGAPTPGPGVSTPAPPTTAPVAPRLSADSRSGAFSVVLALNPDPPPLGQLFEVRATVTDKTTGQPLTEGQVHIDAQMPAHGHGMSTAPVDELGEGCAQAAGCVRPDGVYLTRGLKFHMPGLWTITVEIEGPRGKDVAIIRYEMPA